MSEGPYEGIAIIGIAGRFPGADSVEELWANLVAGKETVCLFTDEELAESGLNPTELRRRGHYVPARGILKDAECFDAAFFSIHPREAEVMDPQQRVFLEICWTALERAGYAPSQIQSTVGVFAGQTFNTFYLHALHSRPDLIDLVGSDLVMFGNEKDYLTTRVAYKLGLKGPAVNVSTACSTSLVAVAQACQSLLTYQCDMALAGGVSITVPQKRGYYYDEGNIGSSDGHTRTFDLKSSGTTFSNGVGVVVLKRFADAVADNDQIVAVIKAAALNNDGSHRVSFGAPGVEGQSEVIATAHAIADINPETVTCVEAHGTATPLGDPIEVAALTKAFRLGTQAKQFCAIGSVKTNFGHLDAAAGVTGLIKMALALHHKIIPPSLHFSSPNPKLNLDDSPFYVNSGLQEWKTKPGVPRRAGVSSFGTGGTNAHVVLEETPYISPSGPSRPWQLLTLSAKTVSALDQATQALATRLREIAKNPDAQSAATAFADAAFTLKTGRSEFSHRRVVACQGTEEGASLLESGSVQRVFTGQQAIKDPPVFFMFPGQGAQYPNMGAELYRSERTFQKEVDRCAALLEPILEMDIRTVIFSTEESLKNAEQLLLQTRFTQPALFVIEYAMARLWMSWGIKPAGMIGHSVGEYVAACIAGVFALEDALSLVARRGALVQAQPNGAMLSVRLPEKELLPMLSAQMAIAAVNSPKLSVVAGPHHEIANLERQLETCGAVGRRLHTSHAFHSPMMDPVLAPFTGLLRQTQFNEPTIPFVSNVTARWITSVEATTAEYWASHVRQTVRFSDGIANLMKDPRNVLLEVGPGHTLSTLARQHPCKSPEQTVLSSLALTGDQELRGILETLGRLWMAGANVDWQEFYKNERRQRVVLPTYPFERKWCWPASPPVNTQSPSAVPSTAIIHNERTEAGVGVAQEVQVKSGVSSDAIDSNQQHSRKERLLAASRSLLQELSGYDLSAVDASASLLELGLDSLLLTQASQLFQRKFGVAITFRQLMEELSSLDSIASHLDTHVSAEAFPPDSVTSAALPKIPMASAPPNGSSNAILEQLLQQQQQLTSQLLLFMGRQPVGGIPTPDLVAPALPASPQETESELKSHGPFRPLDRAATLALSPKQNRLLNDLIARYTSRTAGSKKLAMQNREVLADPRSATGFKQLWKEMVYPIATVRSEGSRVWDVDGNEYIDFVMGFGASLFGHRPSFVVEAVQKQLERGFEIGPIQPLVGEVATLIREFTGMQRVGFTNTGSEAVLAATRVARTVTGRDTIVVFSGAYHGIFDEVLVRPRTVSGEPRAAAIAPGIPDGALGQVIVLDWGNPQSFEYLRTHGSEIAAVMVEPVQSRRLDLQPRDFLREVRAITEKAGTALIFDEVVTGFRVHPGGAQAYFGIQADLATYGKVLGGGLPIGVVAGSARFMDALDGGAWNYGDSSFPEVGVTFFAGTFVRHPLAMAAAKAVLEHLKKSGPELQRRLSERTELLARQLQSVLEEFQAPYHLTQFSSIIHLTPQPEQKLAGLLFYLLRERGIHIWENRAFILTTAHSDDDLVRLKNAFRESLAEMRSGELLQIPSSFVKHSAAVLAQERSDAPAELAEQPNIFPLTEAQKEIWLAAQMGGNAAFAYNESLALKFGGIFDLQLFRQAIFTVIGRHPILLASISEDGEWQRVPVERNIEIPLDDISNQDQQLRRNRLAKIVELESTVPFDLSVGPLLRIRVVRLSREDHVVVWTAHHIVCDGWSGGLLVSELAKTYSALKRGVPPALETPVPFVEYVSLTRDTHLTQVALSYWRQQFLTPPMPLDLPTDRPRPRVRTAGAATFFKRFDQTLYQSLKLMAGLQRTTLVVLLMASLKTLLHRLTGQSDLVIGLPLAGQAVAGKHNLVGHCVHLLPIRTRLEAEASFLENLAIVKRNVLDAYDHHQCTVGTIIQHVSVPRSTSRPPLVEVIFNVDRDLNAAEFYDLSFRCERNPKRALHYDFFFNFVEGPLGLAVECDYNTDLFEEATIEIWFSRFETLLAAIVAKPTESVGALSLLPEAERRELIALGSQPPTPPPSRALLQCFEDQVGNSPDNCAVICEGANLTYRELNRRSNQLARYLQGLGIGPDKLVGVLVERSLDMIVTLLAVLKAGGAYVPLDPAFPPERLKYMVESSGMLVLVTHRNLDHQLMVRPSSVVRLDVDGVAIGRQPDGSIDSPKLSLESLAYVLYTSGSTGKPKGVEIRHSSLTNFLDSMRVEPGFRHTDTLLAVTTLSFDIAGLELYLPLMTGGKLVIASRDEAQDPIRLIQRIRESDCTMMQATPAMWRSLVNVGWKGSTKLKVLCGGEPLPHDLAQELLCRCSELWNMYGPTETTIWSTIQRIHVADEPVPIGRPIANTQVYVLDKQRNLVPRGAVGELYIGGKGLARGYLCHAELTAMRFVPNPFVVGELLYQTGDLVRWLPNGTLQCLGRVDTQVKIRGYRVELAEVESVLAQHEAISQCVAGAYEEPSGDKSLVAYFSVRAGMSPAVSELWGHLKKALPDYMVPSVFVTVHEFPLTPNGKIDRGALPSPLEKRMQDVEDFVAPRDPVEQVLAQLWAKVLRVERVGVYDNFFALGGHSLLAVRIIVELEKLYKKRLPLATLLQAPTVSDLASVLRKEHWIPSWSSLVAIRAGGSKPPFFLFHSHGGNVLEYHRLVELLDADQPVYALQATGLDGNIQKWNSMGEMVLSYIDEIKTLQPQGPYFVGGFCFGGLAALEAAQQLIARGDDVALVVMIQTTHPSLSTVPAGMSLLHYWWHRVKKRMDLERENFNYRGLGHFQDRVTRVFDVLRARTALVIDGLVGRDYGDCGHRSMAYVLEALAVEHDRLYDLYQPRPYQGEVLLFRTAKQVPGAVAHPSLGWDSLLVSHLDVCEVPGHQQNVLAEPHVSRLAMEFMTRLNRVRERWPERMSQRIAA